MQSLKRFLPILFFPLLFLVACEGDPCNEIECVNDGVCINGLCDCPDGWTGPDCSEQAVPTTIRVTQIEILRFPPTTTNGAGWDLTSGADIYPVLEKGQVVVWSSPFFVENADASSTYSFELFPPHDIQEPLDLYTLVLYDYEDNGDFDEFIDGIVFTPYNTTSGFPDILELDAGGDVAFRVHIDYIW